MQELQSEINFDYKTIRVTKSRIDKGLLAIPVSLIDFFPKNKVPVKVYFGDSNSLRTKKYTPYTSSSRECRIGGMKEWYIKNRIQDGDEIVIILDNSRESTYRIFPEKKFIPYFKKVQIEIDQGKNEEIISQRIESFLRITNIRKEELLTNEYLRLAQQQTTERTYKKSNANKRKENVPASIRFYLENLYKGHCQLTDFTFIQKNGRPYFEIHHIKPNLGHHPKNLLVVSPNIHTQFTYTDYSEVFDKEGWLRKVKFSNQEYMVKQLIDTIKYKKFIKEIHD